MKKLLLIYILGLGFCFSAFSQNNQAKSKAYYFSAETSFEKGDYADALTLLEKSEKNGGDSNAFIEAMRVKSYAAQKQWEKANRALNKCYSFNPNNAVIKDLSSLLLKIDEGLELEKKRKEDALNSTQDEMMWKQKLHKNTIEGYQAYINSGYTIHLSEAKKKLGKEYKGPTSSGYLYEIGNKLNGKWIGEYKLYSKKNGQLLIIQNFSYPDGKATGEWKAYFPNGQLREIRNYTNGKKTGKEKYYHVNGQLYQTYLWKDGDLIDLLSCFDGKGNPLDKGTIIDSEGTARMYTMDGEFTEEVIYINGKKVFWDDSVKLNNLAWSLYLNSRNNKQLIKAIPLVKRSIELNENAHNTDTYAHLLYKLGEHGQAVSFASISIELAKKSQKDYSSTQTLINEIMALQPEKKAYYEDGQLKEFGKYLDGNKTGEWKSYHDNGRLAAIGKYLDGIKTGEWKNYHYLNEQLYSIGTYANGIPTGEWKYYWSNGQLEKSGKYLDGKEIGEWEHYNKKGKKK